MPYEDIGIYKVDLKAFIGHGGYGDVLQARCTDTHKLHDKVAVKSIPLISTIYDHGVVKALESLAAFSNPHPHIVSLLHHEEKDGRLWLVMDYCDQGDINEYLSNQHADLRQRVAFVRQAVSAVHHMHTLRPRPVVHRAIKTSNVLVSTTSSGPVVKLADFGLEKILSRKDKNGFSALHGMCLFMAPELFAGLSTGNIEHEKPMDMFALGILILALLQYKPLQGLQPMTEGGQPLGMVMFHNYIQQLPNWSPVVFNPNDSIFVTQLKALVACMVRFNPESRVTIEQVKKQIDGLGEIQQDDVNQDAKEKENMGMDWGSVQRFTQQFKQFITPPVTNITMGSKHSNDYQTTGDTVSRVSANKNNVMGEQCYIPTNHSRGGISHIDYDTESDLALPKKNKALFNDGEYSTDSYDFAPDDDLYESKSFDITCVNGTHQCTDDSTIDRNIAESFCISFESDLESKDTNELHENDEIDNESLIVCERMQGLGNALEFEPNISTTNQFESKSETDLMHQFPTLSKVGEMLLPSSGIAAFGWKNEVLVDGVGVFTKFVYQGPKYYPLFDIERLDECPFYITENGYTLIQDDRSFPHTTKVYDTDGAIVYKYKGNYGNLLGGHKDKLVYVCPQQGILSFYKVSNHQNVGEVVLPADVSISSMALCSDAETGSIVIVDESRLHIMDEDGGNIIATSLSYRVNERADPTSNGKSIFLVDTNERLIHVHDWNGHEVWCIDGRELGLGRDEVIVSIGCARGSILHVSVEGRAGNMRMIAFKLFM